MTKCGQMILMCAKLSQETSHRRLSRS